MKEIKELQSLIIEWAKEKNLNDPDKQYLKILEEVGETARAILKNDVPEIKDGIGDIAVTVIIYYWQKGLHLDVNFTSGKKIHCSLNSYFRQIFIDISNDDKGCLWVLSKISRIHNTTLKECLNIAWNEIKDRQGKTVNGTFIKN